MSYPKSFDLSPATAGNPQEPNTEGKGLAVRKPFASLTKTVDDPLLLSLSQAGWEGVPSKGGPTTDAGQSQTTNTTDTSAAAGSGGINNANSAAQNNLSGLNTRALRPGPASTDHTTGAADGRSVSSMGTSDDKTGEPAYGTANAPFVDHEVSHMAPWVQDKLSSLGKE
ncbi:hypothetical protein HDV62DRAFT_89279 [Trichoderma sp. SZMC 28011]